MLDAAVEQGQAEPVPPPKDGEDDKPSDAAIAAVEAKKRPRKLDNRSANVGAMERKKPRKIEIRSERKQ